MGFRTFLPFQHIKCLQGKCYVYVALYYLLKIAAHSLYCLTMIGHDQTVTWPPLCSLFPLFGNSLHMTMRGEKRSEFTSMSGYSYVSLKRLIRHVLFFSFSFCMTPARILNTNTARKLQVMAPF